MIVTRTAVFVCGQRTTPTIIAADDQDSNFQGDGHGVRNDLSMKSHDAVDVELARHNER